MAPAYKLVIRDRSGNKQDETMRFMRLDYSRVINNWSLLTYRVHADFDLNESLDKFWQIEVHRRDAAQGIDWYADFKGFFWFGNYEDPGNGKDDFIVYCPSQNMRLAHEIVAYPAATANRSVWTSTPVETIAKEIVTYNLTAAGTTGDGRNADVPSWGSFISVEADAASGPSIDFACAHQNVLAALQRLADIAGADFDLVKTGGEAWEFRWYAGGIGSDLTASISFSRPLGTMRRPKLVGGRLDEVTRLIVGGQGTEGSRTFATATGPDYHATYNAISGFYAATAFSSTDGLTEAGNARLEQLRALKPLTFEAVQTKGLQYGVHYDLGDEVAARYRGVVQNMKIESVKIAYDNDASAGSEPEKIDIGLEVLAA